MTDNKRKRTKAVCVAVAAVVLFVSAQVLVARSSLRNQLARVAAEYGLSDPDGNFVEFSYGQPLGPGAEDDSAVRHGGA